jgi:hypothetical protein
MTLLDIGYCEKVESHYCEYEKPADWWKEDSKQDLDEHGDIAEWERLAVKVPTLEERFNKLAAQWKSDISPRSTAIGIVTHPAYLEIIKLGEGAIPFILKDLQKQPNHWFIALRSLASNFSPVKPQDAGNIKKMTKAWLKWGKENGKLT